MTRSSATSTRPTPANLRIADTTLSESAELSRGTSTRLYMDHFLSLSRHVLGRGLSRRVVGGHQYDRCLRSIPYELSERILHKATCSVTAVGGHQDQIWFHGPRQLHNRGASGGVPDRPPDWADTLAPKPRRHLAEILRRLIDRCNPRRVTAIASKSRGVNGTKNDNLRARVVSDELHRLRQYTLGPSRAIEYGQNLDTLQRSSPLLGAHRQTGRRWPPHFYQLRSRESGPRPRKLFKSDRRPRSTCRAKPRPRRSILRSITA